MSLKVILFLTWADPLNLSWSFRSRKVQIIRKTLPLPSFVSIASDLLTSEMMIYIRFIVCGLFTCFLSLFPRKRNIPQEKMEFVLTTTASIPVPNTRLVHSRVQYLCVTWISVLKNICVGKKKKRVCGWKKHRFHIEDDCLAHVEIHACFHFPENQWRFAGFDSKILQGLVCHFLYFFKKGWDFIFWLWLNDTHAQLPISFNRFCNNMEVSQYSVSNTVNSWLSVGGLPWCLRWQIICLQCRRSRFDPWVRKLLWRREWLPLQYSCLENSTDKGAWQATVHGVTKSWTWLRN